MSALGQKQTSRESRAMSALGQKQKLRRPIRLGGADTTGPMAGGRITLSLACFLSAIPTPPKATTGYRHS